MYILPCLLIILGSFIYEFFKDRFWEKTIIISLLAVGITLLITFIDYNRQIYDTEVWSGTVIDWNHEEEYDETVNEYNSEGKYTGSHTVHHDAENSIKTSDNGWIGVNQAPDGTVFNDNYPNNINELKQYWKYGTPSASVHIYKNKVQSSYSIYKHNDIDIEKYTDLPEYPKEVSNYINVNRIIGNVPNKANALKALAKLNSEMNKSISDPEKQGKMRSWKQVNLIFVNVGENKSEDYGFALQDKWEGGNKNDFIVSFSMDSNGIVKWVYPFSWSEVEILKIEIRDYILNQKQIKDFVPIVEDVSKMVIDKFERKQFADFNYLQIEVSTGAIIAIWIFNILLGFGIILVKQGKHCNYRNNGWYF
jgi:hypothetical protein